MGKYCNEHYDPTCEKCRASNPEELTQVESSNGEKPKDEGGWTLFIALFIAGFIVFTCWAAVPGFLKPDREVPFLGVGSYVSQDGECSVQFRWKNRDENTLIPLDRTAVALRNDGKSYTTIVLKNREFPHDYYSSSVTILVSSSEDLEKWNKFFDSLKLGYKKVKDLLDTPRYVPPPSVITK